MATRKNSELFHLIEAGCTVRFREVHGVPLLTVTAFNNGMDPTHLFDGPIMNKRNAATASKQGAWTRALKKAVEELRKLE